jgi:hypothetical protein
VLGLLTTAVCNGVLFTCAEHYPDIFAAALLGVALGQISVLVVWTVLGWMDWFVRFLALLGVCLVLAAVVSPKVSPSNAELLTIFLVTAIFESVPLLIMRTCFGLRLATIPLSWSDPLTNRRQFTVLDLFKVTTVACAVAGILQASNFPWTEMYVVLLYCLAFCVVAWLAVATLRIRHGVGLAWLVFLSVASGMGSLAGAFEGFAGTAAVITFCEGLYLVFVAALVRIAGFRVAIGAIPFENLYLHCQAAKQ